MHTMLPCVRRLLLYIGSKEAFGLHASDRFGAYFAFVDDLLQQGDVMFGLQPRGEKVTSMLAFFSDIVIQNESRVCTVSPLK